MLKFALIVIFIAKNQFKNFMFSFDECYKITVDGTRKNNNFKTEIFNKLKKTLKT